MGYLTAKEDLQVYRSISRIHFDPTTGALGVDIVEGFDRNGVFHHLGNARHDLSGAGASVLTAPLSQVLAMLGATAEQATLRSLIVGLVDAAITGSLAPVECVDAPELCEMRDECVTRELWARVKEAIREVLRETVLEDMARRYRRKAGRRV